VKKTGGDTAAELTQAFMKSANQEPWQKLEYTDEDVSISKLRVMTIPGWLQWLLLLQ
jgi:hypothetical protein